MAHQLPEDDEMRALPADLRPLHQRFVGAGQAYLRHAPATDKLAAFTATLENQGATRQSRQDSAPRAMESAIRHMAIPAPPRPRYLITGIAAMLAVVIVFGLVFSLMRSVATAPHGQLVYLGMSSGAVAAYDAQTGKQVWERKVGTNFPSTTLVSNGLLFVSASGITGGNITITLLALDARTGSSHWQFAPKTPPGIDGLLNPVVADQTVLFIAPGIVEMLYALDLASGSEKWSAPITCCSTSNQPVVSDGVVYLGGNMISARRVSDGAVVWQTQAQPTQPNGTSIGYETLNVAGGALLVGEDTIDPDKHETLGAGLIHETAFLAVSTLNGKQNWRFAGAKDTQVWAQSGVDPQTVYVTTTDFGTANRHPILHALDLTSGVERWQLPYNEVTYSSPSPQVSPFGVVFDESETVRMVQPLTGATIWQFAQASYALRQTVVMGDAIYAIFEPILYPAMTLRSWVVAIRAQDGTALWSRLIDGGNPSLIVGQHTVYVATNQDRFGAADTLFALDVASGKTRWSLKTNATPVEGP